MIGFVLGLVVAVVGYFLRYQLSDTLSEALRCSVSPEAVVGGSLVLGLMCLAGQAGARRK